MNTKLFICIAATLLLVVSFCSVSINAQTCKATNAQPFKCEECKTCTGPSMTCCSQTTDAAIGSALAIFQLAKPTDECALAMKTMSCAICDPKNQQYAPSGVFQVCKQKCLEIKSTCASVSTSNLDCTNYPETNCWSSAERIGQSLMMLLVGVMSVVLMMI